MLGLEWVVAGHLLMQASAGAIECPIQKSARVDVRWRTSPVKYDFTRPISRLNEAEIDTVSPYGARANTQVGGLMSGNIKFSSNIQISSVRYTAMRMTCLWVDQVMVDLVIDPTVFVASEYAQGTCRHKAILEHEHKHVALDRRIVEGYLERIRLATAQAVQKVGMVGPKAERESNVFKQKMSDYIQGAIKVQVDAMFAERSRLQLALDSREEYDRVQSQCKD